MKPTPEIAVALAPLFGLPMWEAGFAGDIAWFQFGAAVTRPDYHGGTRVVGQYALHLSCPWRWVASSGLVRADETSSHETLQTLGKDRPCLNRADVADDGTIALRFGNGDLLLVDMPGDGAAEVGMPGDGDEEVEYWRLFQPGSVTPHFVVSSSGAEWHEA